MRLIYLHPDGDSTRRVNVSGLGAFEHAVPREVEDAAVLAVLGPCVAGTFARNACFYEFPRAPQEPRRKRRSVAALFTEPLPPTEVDPTSAPPAQEEE